MEVLRQPKPAAGMRGAPRHALLRSLLARYAARLERTGIAVARKLTLHTEAIVVGWALVFLLAALPRMAFPATPIHDAGDLQAVVLPYLLIALAPVAGYRLVMASFPRGLLSAQPEIRLARYGRWRGLSILEARANPLFGPAGFMASLLVGMLLNIVLRGFEFLLAVPAINGNAPAWGQALFLLMAADMVVMSFFYMVCFTMALRAVPLFPRMLLFVWMLDIAAQITIARQLGAMPDLPPIVAAPLHDLLEGNIQKVMISACVWLPYLTLSDRVNVTYRQRIGAQPA